MKGRIYILRVEQADEYLTAHFQGKQFGDLRTARRCTEALALLFPSIRATICSAPTVPAAPRLLHG